MSVKEIFSTFLECTATFNDNITGIEEQKIVYFHSHMKGKHTQNVPKTIQ